MQQLLAMNDELARRKNILLVDDDPTFLKLVKSWLSEGYTRDDSKLRDAGYHVSCYKQTGSDTLISRCR